MRDRQKFNFVTALIRQLREAADADDELIDDLRELIADIDLVGRDAETDDRLARLEAWVAQLDATLGDDVTSGSEEDSTDALGDDESMPDLDVGAMDAPTPCVVDRTGRDVQALERAGKRTAAVRGTARRAPTRRAVSTVRRGTRKTKK